MPLSNFRMTCLLSDVASSMGSLMQLGSPNLRSRANGTMTFCSTNHHTLIDVDSFSSVSSCLVTVSPFPWLNMTHPTAWLLGFRSWDRPSPFISVLNPSLDNSSFEKPGNLTHLHPRLPSVLSTSFSLQVAPLNSSSDFVDFYQVEECFFSSLSTAGLLKDLFSKGRLESFLWPILTLL